MMENVDKENEPHNHDVENSQTTVAIQPASKLQRLKRSLSFKTIIRSRSVDNFYMKSNTDSRLPPDFLTDPAPPSPPLPPGSPITGDQSPSLIPSPTPSPNPSLCSRSPTLTSSPSLSSKPALQPRPVITHCFLEHIFRRPTSCQLCKNAIVGNSKQALRCKTCKMGAHLWCSSELSQQPCYGKVGLFKRNLSSPLLINDQLGAVKEAPATRDHGKGRVDPVYELLRYGTSLAQMSRSSFGSLSESPTRSVGEGAEEREEGQPSAEDDCSIDPGAGELPAPEIEKVEPEEGMSSQKAPKRIEVHSVHTYVALYKFLPQEPNDLELQPGDRVQVTDDSNEEWWKGKCGDKVGFFPANFVQRVRPGERVWRVTQGSQGNREMGHMAVKESQICVGKSEDGNAYLKLSSGKKRGLVSCDSLEEI